VKSKKDQKKNTLTVKQSKLLKELPTSGSVAEAGEKAGYADRTAAHRALKNLAEKTPEILERLGLGIEATVNKYLLPLLDATETKFWAKDGVVIEQRDVVALDIRLRALEVWARLMGAYTAQKVQLSGGLTVDLNHVSDDELDQSIADLLPPDPREKA
jgi:hypothetical protein